MWSKINEKKIVVIQIYAFCFSKVYKYVYRYNALTINHVYILCLFVFFF